jgi:prevent-host-death family protein
MRVAASKLKARLGHYLRTIRKGRVLVITDRGEEVALLSPIQRTAAGQAFDAVRPRDPASPPLGKVAVVSVASRGRSSLDYLREDRAR